MDISKLDISELKALAYDQKRVLEQQTMLDQARANLGAIELELHRREIQRSEADKAKAGETDKEQE